MLDTRETGYVPKSGAGAGTRQDAPRRAQAAPRLTRDLGDDFGARFEDFDEPEPRAKGSNRRRPRKVVRLKLGGLPQTKVGRIFAGVALVTVLGGSAAVLWGARQSLLKDRRFVVPSSASIQITGNSHVTRAQLLSVFGEDVDRNVLTISLAERQAELERLPWVEHATVMRLLPNHIRVAVTERTPVAFYRQGGQIGLVDAGGVLLDMPDASGEQAGGDPHYSFPVVTGISAEEPLSTRAARMKIYQRFIADLDQSSDKISDKLSEVDLSSPEDVKALIPSGKTDILVHFGEDDFLERYRRFEENLPKWQQDYPKLASADMRYPRQVVLEMAPGTSVPLASDANPEAVAAKADVVKPAEKTKPVVKKPIVVAKKAPVIVKKPSAAAPHAHLDKAFAVPSTKAGTTKTHSPQAGPR